jgi:hypothetical protein
LAACTGDSDTTDTGVPPNGDWANDPFWDLGAPSTFRVELPYDDWESALWDIIPTDDCASRQYESGIVTFVNPTDGVEEIWDPVGIRWRGHSALDVSENSRVGLKLSFNEYVSGQEFYDVRKINLLGTEGDYTAMREHLALRIARDMGIAAPESGYAHLYVNDTYMGFYPMTEEADDEPYVKNHFDNPDGALLKIEGYCGGRGDFEDVGDDPMDYIETYDPKGETLDSAIEEDLFPLIECVNVSSDDDFLACIPGLIDVDNWLTEIAVDVVLPDIDGMIGAGQNYMIYKQPETGLFVIWPWDKDLALDDANMSEDWDLAGVHPKWADDFRNLLGDRLVRSYRQEYCSRVLEVADRYDPATFVPELETHRALIADWIKADPWMDAERWGWITDDVVEVVNAHHPQVVAMAQACDF